MRKREAQLDGTMLDGVIARYGFALASVLLALLLRSLLMRFTGGGGAGFVLILAATMFTSLVAGKGPAIFSLVISLPISFALMMMRGRFTPATALIPLSLYAVDGCVIIYVTSLMQRGRLRLALANAELRRVDVERSDALVRTRETIELAPDAYFLADGELRLVQVNRAACELLGYECDELLGMMVVDIIPDVHAAHLENARERLLESGKVEKVEWLQKRKDGSMVPVEVSANLLPDGRWQAFARDVSERLRVAAERERLLVAERVAREEAQLSEAKFSAIISIAADAIITVDADQRITIFNEGAERIFGYSRKEAIGALLETLVPEQFRAVHRKHFKAFAAGTEAARRMAERREVFGRRKNGEQFPAEASISKVSVNGGMLFSIVLRDITYRKSVEHALQSAVAARDDVLGIVAHDLRNPLATILMQISAMEERPNGAPDRRDKRPLEVISRSANRMNVLIRDLLDVAVVEAGQLKIEHEQLSAEEVAREAVDMETQLATAAQLRIDLEVAPGVKQVCGDHHRLLQVFENLIGNAIKFTKAGGHITLRVSPMDKAVEFAVEDTGEGIAAENIPRLFEKFWQATARASRLGAGMGLVISKGIIEAHGGRVWVESEVGHGTTFHFTIPTDVAGKGRSLRPRGPERRTRRARTQES